MHFIQFIECLNVIESTSSNMAAWVPLDANTYIAFQWTTPNMGNIFYFILKIRQCTWREFKFMNILCIFQAWDLWRLCNSSIMNEGALVKQVSYKIDSQCIPTRVHWWHLWSQWSKNGCFETTRCVFSLPTDEITLTPQNHNRTFMTYQLESTKLIFRHLMAFMQSNDPKMVVLKQLAAF